MNRQEIIEMMEPLKKRIEFMEEKYGEKIDRDELEIYKSTIRTYIHNAIETDKRKGVILTDNKNINIKKK